MSKDLFNINFLGLIINYKQKLVINSSNGLRRNSLILKTGYQESILSEVHEFQNYDTGAKYNPRTTCTEKPIIDF